MARSGFGRDDMNALLGGEDSQKDEAVFRPTMGTSRRSDTGKKGAAVDIAKLTPAETAALLMKQHTPSAGSSSRYRTKKVLAHHKLAEELKISQNRDSDNSQSGKEEEQDGSDGEFVSKRKVSRQKAAPLVLQRKKKESDSDSSSSDNASSDDDSSADRRRQRRRRRQRAASDSADSSSSSEDDEDDRLRQKRLLARRKRSEPTVVSQKDAPPPQRQQAKVEKKKETVKPKKVESLKQKTTGTRKPSPPQSKPKRSNASSSGSGSSSSSSSESDGEESSSSSDDSSSSEDEHVMAKPVFIPKHKRNLLKTESSILEETEARNKKEKEREEKRKMESRTLLAKQLSEVAATSNMDDDNDEMGGATNQPPNDDDEEDDDDKRRTAKEEWQVRELERLLVEFDTKMAKERERAEYERRKRMTDKEALQEDINSGRYQKPGSKRAEQGGGNQPQRFYHRGAYYMDNTEWDQNDIRHKASEYARAATGDDKIDKSKLPEVMQVKNFGMARQNQRYKGLAKEDTTDKGMKMLPLVQRQRQRK